MYNENILLIKLRNRTIDSGAEDRNPALPGREDQTYSNMSKISWKSEKTKTPLKVKYNCSESLILESEY